MKRDIRRRPRGWVPLALVLTLAASGCSVRRMAVNRIGDALASGGSTYTSDDDIQLVGDALPFSLKLVESLLAEAPRHKGLLLTACQGFTSYSYVYVQDTADVVAVDDLTQANQLRDRARRLYLRAHRYCMRGIEVSYPGVSELLIATPTEAAALVNKPKDVPFLYWSAASLGLAISVSKKDAAMLARIPEVEAFVERGLELNPGWDGGALYAFQVTLASARPGPPDFERIGEDYQRAVHLSEGTRASLYVAYAESVCIPEQDRPCFEALLEKALAIDPDEHEDIRLMNLVAQRRARWLLGRVDDLILEEEPAANEEVAQ